MVPLLGIIQRIRSLTINLQGRRLQVRRAQEAYRNRKEAATKSLEQRIHTLEECIQSISNVFMDFTDSMLESETVRRDPKLGQVLFAATSRITSLAKGATEERSEEPRDDQVEDYLLQEELFPAGANEGIPLDAASLPSNFMAPNNPGVSGHRNSHLPPASFAVSSSLSYDGQVFGNGWFGQKPSMPQLSIKATSRVDLEGTFAFQLIQTTLSMTYTSLLESDSESGYPAMRICRFALLYHSREEILFNLRWFLGPGFVAIRSLSRAIFGFDQTLSLQHFNALASSNEAKVFSPFVDAQALVEQPNKAPRYAFMNALDIEEYLRSKGAASLDQDILQIRVPESDNAEGIENSELNFDGTAPKIDVPADNEYFEQAVEPDMLETPGDALMKSYFAHNSSANKFQTRASLGNSIVNSTSNSPSNFSHSFDFNALLESPEKQPLWRCISAKPNRSPVQTRTAFLARSILLENLARNSICLGTGPGFPRASVDTAIESAVWTTPV